jgi:cell filamentation protein
MDPYVYPGTSVLKNLRDIRDPERLSRFEMDMTTLRLSELARNPVPGKFDAHHLQAIHRRLFQDVYAWAGEFRTVNISRAGQFPFAFSDRISQSLSHFASELQDERYLALLPRAKFAGRAAHYLGELNAIHPFGDGNGRAQREFIRELASRNGYTLNWSRVSRDEMREASIISFQRGDNSAFEGVMRVALESTNNQQKD